MTPPLCSIACPSCTMVQAVPAASPRGPAPQLSCLACHEPLGASDDVTRVIGGLEVPAAPIDAGWYAMVHGEVVGPVGREAIARMFGTRVLADDALVWHRGFRGWASLANTATFAPLVGGRRPAPRANRLLDLTDDVALEDAPAPRRPAPPPLPRRLARAS
jgi:GYF domain 2